MKNILIIGAGRFGRYTAKKLNELGHQIKAVDRNESHINKIMPYVTDALIGDSTNADFLKTLGITDFDMCIVAIGDDFLSSLETTSLLEELGAKKIISRATTGKQEKFLLRNGATDVVFPERQIGSWTAVRYSSDAITNFVDLSDGYSIFEVHVPKQWAGKSIGDLNVRKRYGVNVLGIQKETMDMNISADTVLEADQVLLVLGKQEMLEKLFCE